ncbi:lipid II flippase MurJ [Nonlabens ponticola]|uniref:Polysaccharide biosynthesis protein n=1 Tax=Nonlabens ponticola TaxID=2496866 RepID=A0A3S9MZX2_9FLAO|nr:lipid II flippase MurJ [Nonlabens ponticola]AZQ44698.1 hypothetical protein EJ995_10770 [Nonlabens ponticola]
MKIILRLFSFKFLSALLGIGYSILQVYYFGSSRSIEIFFAAQSLVYVITSLTQTGQLAEVFLPVYHKLKLLSGQLHFDALNYVLTKILFFGAFFIVIAFILAPYIIELLIPGFSDADRETAVDVFRVLVPLIVLEIAGNFFVVVLNGERKFGRAEFLSAVNSGLNILILFLFYELLGIWSLVLSLIIAKVLQTAFYLKNLFDLGYRPQIIKAMDAFDSRHFLNALKSTLLYTVSTQGYIFVLTAGTSFLPDGTYAVFKHVQNLAKKAQGLVVQPFITIFFTDISDQIANRRPVSKIFEKCLRSILSISTLTILYIVLFGYWTLDIIWGGSKFSDSDLNLAFIFLGFNSFAIAISGINQVYRKYCVSMGVSSQLYIAWTFGQLLCGVLTYYLIYSFGVEGLKFIIPLNGVLLLTGTLVVFNRLSSTLRIDYFSFSNAGLYLVIGISIYSFFMFEMQTFTSQHFVLSVLAFLVLAAYPLFTLYRLYQIKKGG